MDPIKLYVDDRRPAPDDSWKLARTVTEAIRILATVPVELVSLDHDIMDSEETFEPVCRYLAIMNPRPKVTCHSGNIYAYGKYTNIMGCEVEPLILEDV